MTETIYKPTCKEDAHIKNVVDTPVVFWLLLHNRTTNFVYVWFLYTFFDSICFHKIIYLWGFLVQKVFVWKTQHCTVLFSLREKAKWTNSRSSKIKLASTTLKTWKFQRIELLKLFDFFKFEKFDDVNWTNPFFLHYFLHDIFLRGRS